MDFNPRVLLIEDIEDASKELKEIGVDTSSIKIMSPKLLFRVVKLEGVDAREANIIKQEMLSLGAEAAISKKVYFLEPGKTDVILAGNLAQLKHLCTKLKKQTFRLPQIADEIMATLKSFDVSFKPLQAGKYRLNLSERTYVMGILNVTPDSFSDGGKFFNKRVAVTHAKKMVEEGVDIIDVGGESTRPGAEPVPVDEELRRIIPVIEELAQTVKVPISVDTYKAKVAEEALNAGATIVNDISALRMDKKMADLVAERDIPVILMHMQGTPKNMQENPTYKSVMGEIVSFLRGRAELAIKKGVKREKIIVDPGIGFGKTREHNLEIMRRLNELKSLGYPICLGTSRKSFIGFTLDLPVQERLEGTAATVACGILKGANIIRVHDVKEMVRVARMIDAIKAVRL